MTRGGVAAGVLLLGLLSVSGWQVARDLMFEPEYRLRDGTPVVRVRLDSPGDATAGVVCRPPPDAIAELRTMRWPADTPPCAEDVSGPVRLETWPTGQLVWWPRDRLQFEQW